MTRSIDTMIADLSAGGRRPYAAMTELVEQGETAITALVIALRETKNAAVRDRIATTLTRIGKAAIPALSSVYSSEIDPKIRAAAVDALGEIGDPAALPALTSALRDSDDKVRHLAAYGIAQIQEAHPNADAEPDLAREIEQARVAPPQPVTLYSETSLAENRSPFRRAISTFITRWVFGIDSHEEIEQEVGNPFARWVARPFRKGVAWFLIAAILVYAALCVWEGWVWAAQLSPSYGYVIIRIFVVVVLSLLSAFILPFSIGFFLLFTVINVTLLFFPIGVIHGFTLSPEGELQARNDERHGILLLSFLIVGSVLVAYGYDILRDSFDGFIIGYLLVSPFRILVVGAGVLLLVSRNLYLTIKSRQPVQQPLA